jgi:hypothetical protein
MLKIFIWLNKYQMELKLLGMIIDKFSDMIAQIGQISRSVWYLLTSKGFKVF